jgi:hypothetical protein
MTYCRRVKSPLSWVAMIWIAFVVAASLAEVSVSGGSDYRRRSTKSVYAQAKSRDDQEE